MANFVLFLLFLLLPLEAQGQNASPATPAPTADPEYRDFQVYDYAKFTCEAAGFRCAYVKDQYEITDMSETSQDSIGSMGTEANNLWSNLASDDYLVLQGCEIGYCFVRCNRGCGCTTGNSTCTTGTPPPVAAATNAPLAVCPETINTQLCKEMFVNVPAGNLDNFDCFNFCGNNFMSSCDFEGSCAEYNCDDVGEDGTIKGLVVGCTKSDLLGTSGGGSGSGGGSSGSGDTTGKTSGAWRTRMPLQRETAILVNSAVTLLAIMATVL